jgi:hypothetical protein
MNEWWREEMTIEQLMAKIIAGKAADRERAKALPWHEKIKVIERLRDDRAELLKRVRVVGRRRP